MLMSEGKRDRDFRIRHGYWINVYQHRVWGMTIHTSWVVLGEYFGNSSMEAILSAGVPRTLNTIWESESKLKQSGVESPK